MLRKALLVLCLIISIAIILAGQNAWVSSQKDIHRNTSISSTPVEEEESDQEPEADSEEQTTTDSSEEASEFEMIISNQPEEAQNMWLEHQENEEAVDITLVASEFVLLEDENWTTILQESITSSYSDLEVNFTILTNESNSLDWVESIEDGSIDFSGQEIVLYELATLQDNGFLSTNDQVYYMNRLIEEFETNYSDSILYVQPSQPLRNASNYPDQVQAVKDFVDSTNVTYLDHWTDWQLSDDYLTEDNDPTDLGHETWGNFLANYFSSN